MCDHLIIDGFLDYLRYERNYSSHTIRAYQKDLCQFEEFIKANQGEDFDFIYVEADQVRNWIVALMDAGLSSVSVNRKLSSLKSFFKYLMKQELISVNPVGILTGPKAKKTLPCFIREEEMIRLLEGYHFEEDFDGVRDRLIIELLYDTGMRRSELVGLENNHIDFEAMTVKVTGKRNKQRLIPFAEGLKDLLVRYMEIRDREVEVNTEWLLLRKDGRHVDGMYIYQIVKKWLNLIPALSKRSPHVLRHSFATSMLNNGAELNAVKEILGHKSLASTGIYTHTTFEELKKMYHAHPRAQKEGGHYGN